MLACVSAVSPMILANPATITKVRRKKSTGQIFSCFFYNFLCTSRYAATKDDFLVVIAAGNDGAPPQGNLDKTVN
jgi:hypothetical protein